jgi:hypothetical protein
MPTSSRRGFRPLILNVPRFTPGGSCWRDCSSLPITRRYHAGLKNFFNLYIPLADSWYFYDNSQGTKPLLLASGEKQTGTVVNNKVLWEQITEAYCGSSL